MVSNPSGSVITPEALIPLGPVAFAIHDFYAAMLEFAVETDHPKWYQPPDITCVERASGFSAMRSQLWEMAYSATRGDWPSGLSRWNNLRDFREIRCSTERSKSVLSSGLNR